MIIDLRYKGELPVNIATIYNQIADSSRSSFNQMISEVSEPFKSNLDWWLEGPASRNTLVSPLFHYYISIKLIIELTKSNQNISEILVDSQAIKQILIKFCKKERLNIKVQLDDTSFLSKFVKLFKPI